MRRQKAFSLVELLVVLGILVILFAIVYPAIAKSIEATQKTHALSNLKHLSAAFLQYSVDHEGHLPYAFAWDELDAKWRFDTGLPKPVAIPSGWPSESDYSEESVQKGDLFHWSHAVHRYTKSFDLYEAPGLPTSSLIPSSMTRTSEPAKCSFTFNGLLHHYPLSNVQNPSRTPLLWMGFGRTTLMGFAATNPYLHCSDSTSSGDCQYKPIGGPKGSLFGIKDSSIRAESMWVYGKGAPIAYIDGSARMQNFAARKNDPSREPFESYDSKGVPISYFSQNLVPDLFKPDQN